MSNRQQIVPVNAAHRATIWPSFGGIKVKTRGMPRVFRLIRDPIKALFFSLFGFGFGLIAGPLLERGAQDIAKRGT